MNMRSPRVTLLTGLITELVLVVPLYIVGNGLAERMTWLTVLQTPGALIVERLFRSTVVTQFVGRVSREQATLAAHFILIVIQAVFIAFLIFGIGSAHRAILARINRVSDGEIRPREA